MRPPEFTGGNLCTHLIKAQVAVASMRPPEFTGGNPAPVYASRSERLPLQ